MTIVLAMDVAIDVGRTSDDDYDDETMFPARLARGATHVPDAERQLSRAPRERELYTRETGIDRTGACARPLSWSSFSPPPPHPPHSLHPSRRTPSPSPPTLVLLFVLILSRATHPRPLATTTTATTTNGPD